MRRLIVSFILICSSWSAQADKMPLLTDTTITTTAEILSRIQSNSVALIKAKYSDLQKNFTPNFLTTGLDLDCRTGSIPVNNSGQYAGFRISNESKPTASGLIQSFTSVSHYDCFGRLIFTERIKAIGPQAILMTVADAAKFVRSFEVLAGESARHYQIEDAQAEVVFSVSSQRVVTVDKGERIYSVVEVGGAKWLEFDQLDPSINERRIYVRLHSGNFKVGNSKYRMNFKSESIVLKTLWNERRIEHAIDDVVTNQVSFDSYLESYVLGMTSDMIGQIYSGPIKKLPETKKVAAGVSDSPFLRELQLNYNRMLTSTESEQVKIFFQKTIEDIKSGRLKVDQ